MYLRTVTSCDTIRISAAQRVAEATARASRASGSGGGVFSKHHRVID